MALRDFALLEPHSQCGVNGLRQTLATFSVAFDQLRLHTRGACASDVLPRIVTDEETLTRRHVELLSENLEGFTAGFLHSDLLRNADDVNRVVESGHLQLVQLLLLAPVGEDAESKALATQ